MYVNVCFFSFFVLICCQLIIHNSINVAVIPNFEHQMEQRLVLVSCHTLSDSVLCNLLRTFFFFLSDKPNFIVRVWNDNETD